MVKTFNKSKLVIFLCLIILLINVIHGLKLRERLQDETLVTTKTDVRQTKTIQTISNETESDSEPDADSDSTETTSSDEKFTTIKVTRSWETDLESELNEIEYSDPKIEMAMREFYAELRQTIEFEEVILKTSESGFTINLGSDGSDTSLSAMAELLDISSNFNDITELFSISDSANLQSLKCTHQANQDKTKCYSELLVSQGFYKVEAQKLTFSSVVMHTGTDGSELVNYC